MKKYIFILFISLYSFALCQDAYPYFSDAKKQLEFEKRRVYIKDIEETKQIISGGSTINFAAILDPNSNQPIRMPGNVKTSYEYISIFEITKGNEQISEIEFLELLGLQDEVDRINIKYEHIVDEHNKKMEIFVKTKTTQDTYALWVLYASSAAILMGVNGEGTARAILLGLGVFGLSYDYIYLLIGGYGSSSTPVLEFEQEFSNDQITSLADSYNRSIYKEIQDSN